MGWCSEFGVEIAPCDHPMTAGTNACHCTVCGTTCEGRFDGCPHVWARGPVEVEFVRAPRASLHENGEGPAPPPAPDEPSDRYQELLDALQGITVRLESLERELTGRAEGNAAELARRLDELPRAIGREVRAALGAPEEPRPPRAGRAAS